MSGEQVLYQALDDIATAGKVNDFEGAVFTANAALNKYRDVSKRNAILDDYTPKWKRFFTVTSFGFYGVMLLRWILHPCAWAYIHLTPHKR